MSTKSTISHKLKIVKIGKLILHTFLKISHISEKVHNIGKFLDQKPNMATFEGGGGLNVVN